MMLFYCESDWEMAQDPREVLESLSLEIHKI